MSRLRIHYFQQVSYEGIGCMEKWAGEKGHVLSSTRFYANFDPPDLQSIDWLIVMGGPMNIYEEDKYPWLKEEKAYIRKAIDTGKVVLGICLGSQLIASVLGASVFKNRQKEIGWFNIFKSKRGEEMELIKSFERETMVFHWHGDTFNLPEGAIHLFHSAATENQAFIYNERVIGLQFHPEITPSDLKIMVESGLDELVIDKYIESSDKILSNSDLSYELNRRLMEVLDYLEMISANDIT